MTVLSYLRLPFIAVLLIAGTSCSSDGVKTAPPPSLEAYRSFRTNIHAATVAIGGTQRLTAAAYFEDGTVITQAPAPSFQSLDTTRVKVDATGRVTGLAGTGGSPTYVIASIVVEGVTFADTTIVAVTPGSTVVKAVVMTVQLGNTTRALGDRFMINATAFDANDDPIPGVAISMHSLNPTVIRLTSFGLGEAIALGKARLVASTTSYGVTTTDTVEYVVQYPMTNMVSVSWNFTTHEITFAPDSLLLGVGGTVIWYGNGLAGAVGVTFDGGAANVVGGNIAPFSSGTQSRQFTAAGTYTFSDPGSGARGRVVVKVQPTP